MSSQDTTRQLFTEIGCLEHPFMKASVDEVVRVSKSCQKLIDTEMVSIIKAFDELAGSSDVSAAVVDARLAAMQTQIEQLEDQMQEIRQAESEVFEMCAARVQHLQNAETMSADLWKQLRVNRFLADYLLRNGLYDTAEKLAAVPALASLINVPLFQEVRALEQHIRNREFEPVLVWHARHEQRLRRLGSTLLFKLELQVFIELIRKDERAEALAYARTAFPKHAQQHMDTINKAVGVLVFPQQHASQELLSEERLEDLVQQLRRNNFALHSLTAQSVFDATLQIGVSAFKTVHCGNPNTALSTCPTCSKDMQPLAAKMPYSVQTTSKLYCRISNARMDEHNPPYMLPNGQVYSEQALRSMQETNGHITCPETHNTFHMSECKRVYIV
ncbi:hypothetical protein PTSG_02480 [Salpingoeca rosetta]|uniref:Macrophage erythroblast attacher n=1 Tax=Salpingoeca rosetta (strain ATCC 50818 / BSB-021) TaxID=946362 RepID=F2U2B5_SALR5|nr:uncharacterized protein PTSG_02480 [Salpingoeca rosetta]EGD81767.1 hypothetical protein PTSG_02480 [Salpingoeca rosetta]|eukprot:XP_004996971.1 hypothetical protein PTSG_02480 [Salpingoeca rosetta]